jgi:hypothetical protein
MLLYLSVMQVTQYRGYLANVHKEGPWSVCLLACLIIKASLHCEIRV